MYRLLFPARILEALAEPRVKQSTLLPRCPAGRVGTLSETAPCVVISGPPHSDGGLGCPAPYNRIYKGPGSPGLAPLALDHPRIPMKRLWWPRSGGQPHRGRFLIHEVTFSTTPFHRRLYGRLTDRSFEGPGSWERSTHPCNAELVPDL